jgi:hypothetical protein
MSCSSIEKDVQKIHKLPFPEEEKAILESILLKELSGERKKSRRRKRKRPTRRGGTRCSTLECLTLLSTMIFIIYKIRVCAINVNLVAVMNYAISTYHGALSVLLGHNARASYEAAAVKPQAEQDAVAFKETIDVAGKAVLIHRLAGFVATTLKEIAAHPTRCKSYLPDPVIQLLSIFCKVENGEMKPAEGKERVNEIFKPPLVRQSSYEEFYDALDETP